MKLYTIKEFSKIVKYSIHTLYKKKNKMELGVHYFQNEKGKILFNDNAITFILNKKDKNESIERNNFQKEKQSVFIHQYFNK